MYAILPIALAAALLGRSDGWTVTRAQIDSIAIALEEYREDHGVYPRTDEQGTWFTKLLSGPYLLWKEHHLWPDPAAPGPDAASRSLPLDPWGTPFRYISFGGHFELYSFGPNRLDDGNLGDDISQTNFQPPRRWRFRVPVIRDLWDIGPLVLLAALLLGPFLMLCDFARRPRRDPG